MRIRNTAKNRSDKTKSDSEVYSICRVLPYPEDPNKESNGEESTDEADDDVSDLQDPRPFKFNLGGRLQNKENTKFENVRNKHNGQWRQSKNPELRILIGSMIFLLPTDAIPILDPAF